MRGDLTFVDTNVLLYTQDRRDGRRLGGLTIRNPFRSDD